MVREVGGEHRKVEGCEHLLRDRLQRRDHPVADLSGIGCGVMVGRAEFGVWGLGVRVWGLGFRV